MKVRTRLVLTTAVVLVSAGLVALLPLGARSIEPREVVVVARQMSFYIGDNTESNPAIHVTPGERIRITLVSADPGFDHDFAVRAWGVKTPVLHGDGQTSIVVQAPQEPGKAVYLCSSHPLMMSGTIEVIAPRTAASER